MSVHFVSIKGDRTSNEDNHNIIVSQNDKNTANINYYGVYDGHGGKFVSKFLSENLYHFFIDKKVIYPLSKKYINCIFDKINNILFTKYENKATECGSTCLVVCHFKNKSSGKYELNVMNTGDSRCVLCRDDIAIPLTRDHKPNLPKEFNRITKLGGILRKDRNSNTYRINDLSVSRAFGDKESNKFITHRPEIYYEELRKEDRFIVLACDGLWDVMSSQDVVDFIIKNCYDTDMRRINHKINIARQLAERASKVLKCGDNVTCIVVFFD